MCSRFSILSQKACSYFRFEPFFPRPIEPVGATFSIVIWDRRLINNRGQFKNYSANAHPFNCAFTWFLPITVIGKILKWMKTGAAANDFLKVLKKTIFFNTVAVSSKDIFLKQCILHKNHCTLLPSKISLKTFKVVCKPSFLFIYYLLRILMFLHIGYIHDRTGSQSLRKTQGYPGVFVILLQVLSVSFPQSKTMQPK